MNVFDLHVMKIRASANAIVSSLHNLGNVKNPEPFDLTAYDLRQSERSLRKAADQIATIRKNMEGNKTMIKASQYVPQTPNF